MSPGALNIRHGAIWFGACHTGLVPLSVLVFPCYPPVPHFLNEAYSVPLYIGNMKIAVVLCLFVVFICLFFIVQGTQLRVCLESKKRLEILNSVKTVEILGTFEA